MKKTQMQRNIDTRTYAYKVQKARRELIEVMQNEVYIFLSTLFGNHIEEGRKRIADFGDMTMFDVGSEIKLRTQMMRTHNNARVRHHFEEEQKKQDQLLARLKATMG